MTDSLRELVRTAFGPGRGLTEVVEPHHTFDDVVLPASTRRAIAHALSLIQHHQLIFQRWGLAERHEGGRGLAFHFAGAPGTGKTICAEALAAALGRELLVVRYAELQSMWAGQTAKHVADVFRAAARQDAVLFFDEADAIAGRRSSEVTRGYEREANAVVNVLLHELERFPGVIIFATNLAQNLDPAFERRILTHIRFERPGPEEREEIWRVQLHPTRTPLADDVDFAVLAQKYDATGGEIRNAVLKAAQIAAAQPGPDGAKRIRQGDFEQGMEEVLAAASVMEQSLFEEPPAALAAAAALERSAAEQGELRSALAAADARMAALERGWQQLIDQADALRAEIASAVRDGSTAAERQIATQARTFWVGIAAVGLIGLTALVLALLGR